MPWRNVLDFGCLHCWEVSQVIRRTTRDPERRTSDSFVEHIHRISFSSNCRIGSFFCRSLSRVGDICSYSYIFRRTFERSFCFFISVMLNRQGTSDSYPECFYSEVPRLSGRTRRCVKLFGSVVNIRLRNSAASEQRVCFASEPRLSCRDGG